PSDTLTSQLKSLAAQERWQDLVDAFQRSPDHSADDDYQYGIALAKLNRLDTARAAFLWAQERYPQDPRFPTELAGLAFKERHREEAKKWIHRALQLSPSDEYAADFLGTLYFLDGNLEACLKYWNRIRKPVIEGIGTEPKLKLDPVILDRALAFSNGEVLRRQDLLASESRLRALGIFPVLNFQLEAKDNSNYNIALRARESNGFGSNKWFALLNTFRGVIFETVTPEYYNFKGSGTNIKSLYRWDQNKRRAFVSVSGPFRRNPQWQYQARFDFRNENWLLDNFSALPEADLGGANVRKEAAAFELSSFRAATWNWSTGAEFSHRDFRSVTSTLSPELFLGGNQLKHFIRASYDLLRVPEHRLVVTVSASSQEGRTWNAQDSAFAKLQFQSAQHWFPQATGDDFEMQSRVRYGRTLGSVPFDELLMLGIERDNELMMRGHNGSVDGRKGSAPLGRNYFLVNWEMDKNLYGNGLLSLTLGPFVDTGKITDPNPALGTRKWLTDTGAQFKVRALGARFAVTYGKDLRTGNNIFYAYVVR
ncbi:MAG TPA: hypothetical protein VF135_10230, partial [Terriglobales bacterium]